MMRIYVSSIGQDSHRFCKEDEAEGRELALGNVVFPEAPPLAGNSDADVLLHAVTNAVSGLTGKPVLGPRADALCGQGVKDSKAYLELALEDLWSDEREWKLHHLSLSLEAARPKILPRREEICARCAELLGLPDQAVCLTATTGEGLTSFGRGEGIQALAILSASRNELPV